MLTPRSGREGIDDLETEIITEVDFASSKRRSREASRYLEKPGSSYLRKSEKWWTSGLNLENEDCPPYYPPALEFPLGHPPEKYQDRIGTRCLERKALCFMLNH